MHNLHFILINADSAAEAASGVENEILDWSDENNWRRRRHRLRGRQRRHRES